MYIRTVHLANVRGFLDGDAATDIQLTGPGWHVFAGRNGTGKSTLLRAIALAVIGPDHARALPVSGWVRRGTARAHAQVGIERTPNDHLQGTGVAPKKPVDAALMWEVHGNGGEPRLTSIPERKAKLYGPWRGPWHENPRGWLIAGYGPFRRLTGHAADAQRAMVGAHHERRLVSLFREDASLLEATTWMKAQQFRVLENREGAEALLHNVLALLNDRLLPDGAKIVRVDSDGLWVRRAGNDLELGSLSDGYRVVLALVLDILRHMHDAFGALKIRRGEGGMEVDMPGVVLIDEADAHLHVSWQQRIGFWLTRCFPKVQFLVTTHSPFICQAASPRGLFTLPGTTHLRGVQPVDEQTYKKVVNGTPDEAVLSTLFGLEHARSERAEALTREWSVLRAGLARARLSVTQTRRMREIEDQLPLPFEPLEAGA